MPYQGWFGTKPNVSHLHELGAPIWVLLQGQNIARKILPKLKRQAYVGYNDASKSVIYYNAETRKILTSHNYVFLTPKASAPAKEIQITGDTPQREKEREERDAQEDPESSTKQKRKNLEPVPKNVPRKTRGVQCNYRTL